MEFLNPLQRFYACGPVVHKKANATKTVCLVGPQGELTLFDTTGLSEEIPGSKCHRGYQNNGGVCVAIDSANEKFYNPKYFLEDINQIRKDYAQKYSVPNMHQLVWSNEIFQFLDTLEYTNISQQSGKIWRHDLFLGSAYFNALSDFEGMNDPYFKKSTKTMIPGKAKLFDMDTVSRAKNVVGSQCAAKYTDEDGLCVPEDSSNSKLSFFGNPTDFVKDVNLMRKTYAHKFNVPNMHQLVWKDSLVSIAKSFDESRSSPKARVTWRYKNSLFRDQRSD
ncbi:hypothetical protein GCK72_007582 [Caenorhabditis remanei]|uniref:Uncharacterized protein n=1 Tax=Caenorhabditis remanei TaxID=31234 RepID=A0A6A5HMP0_CAERE|nr:hypothetical protein GCK72_007582 [Caenorhabditis remanei]KAF1767623.1 hypothetical protein GCK72_007582 [Caenorhabditis remanei]